MHTARLASGPVSSVSKWSVHTIGTDGHEVISSSVPCKVVDRFPNGNDDVDSLLFKFVQRFRPFPWGVLLLLAILDRRGITPAGIQNFSALGLNLGVKDWRYHEEDVVSTELVSDVLKRSTYAA